jgi:hypothetical protein
MELETKSWHFVWAKRGELWNSSARNICYLSYVWLPILFTCFFMLYTSYISLQSAHLGLPPDCELFVLLILLMLAIYVINFSGIISLFLHHWHLLYLVASFRLSSQVWNSLSICTYASYMEVELLFSYANWYKNLWLISQVVRWIQEKTCQRLVSCRQTCLPFLTK